MQFVDLKRQQALIRPQIEANLMAVLDHGRYVMGPEIEQLESKLAHLCGVKHAIGCASGTDALLMALMASGIGPGDGVFTSPFTFIATAEAIRLVGATPIFVDIEPDSFNIDPQALAIAVDAAVQGQGGTGRAKPPRPAAVMPVDLFGLAADYDRINTIAARHQLVVIEDAAQSFGATYKGRRTCSLADVAGTSFFPAKPLGCYGDGGMCFTDDDHVAEKLRSVRMHGQGTDRYEHERIGINGRLDSFQAAVLLAKCDIFEAELIQRRQVADNYTSLLSAGNGQLKLPGHGDDYRSAWAQYSILAENDTQRDLLRSKLQEAGIPTAVYYPIPLHLQRAFLDLGYQKGDFPVSEACCRRIFSIPMHPYLEEQQQRDLASVINAHLVD